MDPLFLQIKEANDSVLERHHQKSRYRNHGQRVVEGQRLTQRRATSSSAGSADAGRIGRTSTGGSSAT
jgi:hypothetical protein